MKAMKESTPLISVIVPIFNVALCLRKCLESLKKQSLKQIEVICIDDGSTDGSGQIAEEYKSDDWPVFRIIHTENRGLSAARNRGVDEAKSELIMFVDSDDWVEMNFCKIPYENAVKYAADIVIFNRYLSNENGTIKHERNRTYQTGLIDWEMAIDIGWPAVWNKLYHRNLFDSIKFPDGRVYEELLVNHKLIYAASRIVMIDDVLYFYRIRRDGITHTRLNDMAWLNASKTRYQELKEYGYPQEKAKAELLKVALKCCGRAKDINSPVYKKAEVLLNKAHGIPAGFSFKEKMMMVLFRANKHFYRFAYKLLRG